MTELAFARGPMALSLAFHIVFAAVGMSGTVLSFELGLLFPRFMEHAGAVIGMPFSLEGFAFFTEAIFLGIYLYGWDRVSPRLHLAAGAIVALSGVLSAVFVTIASAWMNAPRGFRVRAPGSEQSLPWGPRRSRFDSACSARSGVRRCSRSRC